VLFPSALYFIFSLCFLLKTVNFSKSNFFFYDGCRGDHGGERFGNEVLMQGI